MSRLALIGTKIGMTSSFTADGSIVPLTIVKVDSNVLVGVRSSKKDGYNAVIIGSGTRKEKNVNKPQLSFFKKIGIEAKKAIKEFRVCFDFESNQLPPINFQVNESMKEAVVDITSISKGKGFQGVMKRHGFKGQPASHGVSITHRCQGSTGQRELPGKVFKNKKMAGRMGATSVTVQNLKVFDIDLEQNLIILLGTIPGFNGCQVIINDAIKSRASQQGLSSAMVNGVDLSQYLTASAN